MHASSQRYSDAELNEQGFVLAARGPDTSLLAFGFGSGCLWRMTQNIIHATVIKDESELSNCINNTMN